MEMLFYGPGQLLSDALARKRIVSRGVHYTVCAKIRGFPMFAAKR